MLPLLLARAEAILAVIAGVAFVRLRRRDLGGRGRRRRRGGVLFPRRLGLLGTPPMPPPPPLSPRRPRFLLAAPRRPHLDE